MIPKLIHPVDCVIVRLKDEEDIEYSDDFDEPITADDDLYDTDNPITINGQVRIFTWDELQAKLSGYSENAKGYLLVKKNDATSLIKSDKIITIAGNTVKNFIIEIRPASFYNKTFYFYKLIFTTKDKGISP